VDLNTERRNILVGGNLLLGFVSLRSLKLELKMRENLNLRNNNGGSPVILKEFTGQRSSMDLHSKILKMRFITNY
jgi:hypothetical protein